MVKLSELRKKYQEELKKQKAKEVLDGFQEEIEVLVIDMGYTQGGLAKLYSIDDAYITPITEEIMKIEEMIRTGKIVRIKATKLKGTKRLVKITDIREEPDPDIPEDRVLEGIIEYIPPNLRLIADSGEIYYLDMGSINFERLTDNGPGSWHVIVIPGITYSRTTPSGQTFKRIKGYFFTEVSAQESETGENEPITESQDEVQI